MIKSNTGCLQTGVCQTQAQGLLGSPSQGAVNEGFLFLQRFCRTLSLVLWLHLFGSLCYFPITVFGKSGSHASVPLLVCVAMTSGDPTVEWKSEPVPPVASGPPPAASPAAVVQSAPPKEENKKKKPEKKGRSLGSAFKRSVHMS